MICRVSIHLPKSAQRRIRVYLRRVANPDRCPRCQSFDTWRWTRGNGAVSDVARYFGRQLLTCRGCANLFYVRANNRKPVLARAFESIGFEPLPVVRAWRVRPPQEPAAWIDRAAKGISQDSTTSKSVNTAPDAGPGIVVDHSGLDHRGVDEPAAAEMVSSSDGNSQGWHHSGDSAPRNGSPQTSFVDSAQRPASVSADDTTRGVAAIVASEATAAVGEMAPEATESSVAVAIVEPDAAVDALFTLQARQQPVNIRQWQDQSWEVSDWEGNVWTTTSAAAAGGSTGALSTAVGDTRKVG
jgi:hypothetical protein